MSKSRDAFRTISEVADWLDTPAHVLRFWESKFTQVKPVKRAGGRRYYRPADMLLLGGIKKLLHDDGLTIKGAQKLLREHGVKHVSGLSQPLDEDVVEEAGFIDVPEAPPAPQEPARVLNFRPREETAPDEADAGDATAHSAEAESEDASTAATAKSDDGPAQAEADTADTDAEGAGDTQATEPVFSHTAQSDEADAAPGAETTDSQDDDAPTFDPDSLPAFLRRSAPETTPPVTDNAPSPDDAQPTEMPPVAAKAPDRNDAEQNNSEAPAPSGLTIDPVARLVPVEADSDEDVADALETQGDALADTPEDSEPATLANPALMADVPPVAKIAPEISSYSDAGGVLSALKGARRLSPDLADDLSGPLAELRALRDRMAATGR
ncbi:MAG: MerR family transcriptional regulator [Pseudomonadota bacterium]